MAGNNFCVNLKLPTECSKDLGIEPNPETPYQSVIEDASIRVLCPHWSPAFSNCFDVLEKLGDVLGKDDSTGLGSGTLDPEYLSSGTYIYALTINVSTGHMELRLGVTGDEYEKNTKIFLYEAEEDNIELQWDGTSKYVGTNLSFALSLDARVGTRVCFTGIAIPHELISYAFSELVVE